MNFSQNRLVEVADAPRVFLQFETVSLGYGRTRVLSEVSFSLHRGDFLAIVGANGAGKSTLLKAILGLVKPQSGSIKRAANLSFGYVPQLQTVDELFPLTVGEVVMMGRYGRIGAARRPRQEDFAHLQQSLQAVGIAELESRLYRDLSGGQKQRALIARAVVGEPDVLVLDEHTNDLDIGGERAIMALLEQLQRERNFAVVMVSHSLNTVANHARSIGLIRDGNCSFDNVETVMNSEFLSEFYGIPLQVLALEGRRVVA